MSETRPAYQTDRTATVSSAPQQALAELSAYYAQIPEDLLASGKPSAVVVYGILDRIAHEGTGWATVEAIGERGHLSPRTVKTARAWLVSEGWLVVIHQGRSGRATDYQLPWRATRQRAKAAPSTCNIYPLQSAKIAHHQEPLPEPKIPEPFTKEEETENFPEWFKTLSQDPRWHGKDPERYIKSVEKAYPNVNLDLEAHNAYEWLQSPKGQKKKVLRGFWINWLKNVIRDPPGPNHKRSRAIRAEPESDASKLRESWLGHLGNG